MSAGSFVHFKELKASSILHSPRKYSSLCKPPSLGAWDYGWGFAIRDDQVGDLVGARVKQGTVFSSLELKQANACLQLSKELVKLVSGDFIVEGDCLSLWLKLKKRHMPRSSLGLTIDDILSFAQILDFLSWNHILRAGNRIAHYLAQPYDCILSNLKSLP